MYDILAQESLSSIIMPRHKEKDLQCMTLSPQSKGFKELIKDCVFILSMKMMIPCFVLTIEHSINGQ